MAASGRLDSTLGTALMHVALAEARLGADEGGIPIGAALVERDGTLLGRGHNRRVQRDDPTAHAETEAFRAVGRRRHYGELIMVTTLSPCWFCSGLIRQFGIGAVVIGECATSQVVMSGCGNSASRSWILTFMSA